MNTELTRSQLDAMQGPLVVEFGAGWCPICRAARPLIDDVVAQHPDVQYFRIEDGRGKPLGRSFAVKLWPTLIFWNGGREVARLIRPTAASDLEDALGRLRAPAP